MDEYESVRAVGYESERRRQNSDENEAVHPFQGTCRGTACSHTDLEKFSCFWGFQLRLGGLGAGAVSRDVLVRGLV